MSFVAAFRIEVAPLKSQEAAAWIFYAIQRILFRWRDPLFSPMGSKFKVVIQKPTKNHRFSNGDQIRGTAHLSVPKSLTLKRIKIELRCIARSLIMIVRRRTRTDPFDPDDMSNVMINMINGMTGLGTNRASEQEWVADSQVLVHKSVEVFPPPEIRRLMETKSFTLTAGDYEYPFDFQLPAGLSLDDSGGVSIDSMASITRSEDSANFNRWVPLPPSLRDLSCSASVSYLVYATAERSSTFRSDLRSDESFDFAPRINIQPLQHFSAALSGQIAAGRDLKEKLPIVLEVRFPNPPYIVTGREPCFRLFVVSMDGAALGEAPSIYIQSIKLSMTKITQALVPVNRSSVIRREHQTREVDTVIADRKYDNLEFSCSKNQYEEIPLKHYADFVISEDVVPSFAIRNIVRRYRFKFTIGVSVERLSSPPAKNEPSKQVQYVTIECQNLQVIAGGLDDPEPIPATPVEATPYISDDHPVAPEKPPISAYST